MILITGSSGFIGKALFRRMSEEGVSLLKLNSDNGGICNKKNFATLVDQPISHVFHLASKTNVPESWVYPEEFLKTNLLGTKNVLDFCQKRSIPLTYVSAYIYGSQNILPIDETRSPNLSNPYAQSKRLAEELCLFYQLAYALPVTIVRPFNVYGPGQADTFLIPTIISQAAKSNLVTLKTLKPRRDFIFISDLIEALYVIYARRTSHKVYNIGSGKSYSVSEVAHKIVKIMGTPKKIVGTDEERANEIDDCYADISKIKAELGWQPKVSLDQGLRLTLDITFT